MYRILILLMVGLLPISAWAQRTQIEIRSSRLIKGFQASGFTRVIQPVFAHEGSTLGADSADYNHAANTFEAFGHVVITQPSGQVIYADHLNYNGNTKEAVLTNNVRMIDGDATLTTDHLTYNMGARIGTYLGGGKIVNGRNTLTSQNGYYFASTRDVYFRHKVVLRSPDALIHTDTLRYNTTSKIAYFYGPTNIYGKDDTLYTENGTYNTVNDQARFGKNNLYTQGSKSMKGDSLFYDRKAGIGRAIGNIVFVDTVEKGELRGQLGHYRKQDESILVTGNPYVVILSENDSTAVDSIWYTADTLFSKVMLNRDIKSYNIGSEVLDSPENTDTASAQQSGSTRLPTDSATVRRPTVAPTPVSMARDSILSTDTLQTDTAKSRVVMAFHNVRIFKSDLQARADSMFFSYSDSILRCYSNPMIWSQNSQLSGDTIYLQMKNKKLDNMVLVHNSFIVSTEDPDSTNFNQIKGRTITGYFRNNKLDQMFVDGNSESIYYVKDDSVYIGLNHQVSSRMKLIFGEGKLSKINFIRSIQSTTTPMEKLKDDQRILKGFIWKPRDRPQSKESIIPQQSVAKGTTKSPSKPVANKPRT